MSNKQEGDVKDSETLAIFLAVGHDVRDPMPVSRLEFIEAWQDKRPEVQVAYRLRAMRLLRAWGVLGA